MKHNLNVKARTSTSTMIFHFPINMGPSCLKYETKRQLIVFKHKRLNLMFFDISNFIAMNTIRVSKEDGLCVNVSSGLVYTCIIMLP